VNGNKLRRDCNTLEKFRILFKSTNFDVVIIIHRGKVACDGIRIVFYEHAYGSANGHLRRGCHMRQRRYAIIHTTLQVQVVMY
jgi:hypothetical protein